MPILYQTYGATSFQRIFLTERLGSKKDSVEAVLEINPVLFDKAVTHAYTAHHSTGGLEFDSNLLSEIKTERRFSSPYGKIVDEETALQIIDVWKQKGLQVVVADAVLDLPHYRHPDYFLVCANFGNRLVIRLATDELVKSRKNPEGPIVSWAERAKHAAHYPYIDLIMPKKANGWDWIAKFLPNTIVNSTTSPVFIIEELQKNSSRISELGIRLVALDQFANEIPFENLYQQCLVYNERKYGKDKFSGTIIKDEIGRRAIEKYLNELRKDNVQSK